MQLDLTRGNITATMLRFMLPMVLGNLLQQFYNVADTLIVGRFLGTDALAAVGFCLYAHELPHLYPAGVVHGKRGGVFSVLRTAG